MTKIYDLMTIGGNFSFNMLGETEMKYYLCLLISNTIENIRAAEKLINSVVFFVNNIFKISKLWYNLCYIDK